MKRRIIPDLLILLPGLWGMCVIVYFSFLTGTVPLSSVLPVFYYLYYPSCILTLIFAGFFLKHLLGRTNTIPAKERVLWIIFALLFAGIALPVYRFTRMRETDREPRFQVSRGLPADSL